jgi:hypothetical protein
MIARSLECSTASLSLWIILATEYNFVPYRIPMPRIPIPIPDIPKTKSHLDRWFRKHGFIEAHFERGTLRVSTDRMGEIIVFKLNIRAGYETHYKVTTGGALIVFETRIDTSVVDYDGYCPLLLFGIWNRKLAFKENAGVMFKYRAEGYDLEREFLGFAQELGR